MLYDIERQIHRGSAQDRHGIRQAHSKPKVDAFRLWAEQQLTCISGKSDLAKAFRNAHAVLPRSVVTPWRDGAGRRSTVSGPQERDMDLEPLERFTLFLEDGRVAIDNNAAERPMRPIGIGRKNWLFAGSDAGGETLARAMTLIETAKLSSLDPQTYLADVLDRINDYMNTKLQEAVELDAARNGHRTTDRRLSLLSSLTTSITTSRKIQIQAAPQRKAVATGWLQNSRRPAQDKVPERRTGRLVLRLRGGRI